MRVFKKRNVIRILMTSALIYFIVQGCVLVLKVNEKLYPQVKQMAVIEASNAASMVIKKAVSTIELHPDECMELTRDETGDIIEINMGQRPLKVKVLNVTEYATKENAADNYIVVE